MTDQSFPAVRSWMLPAAELRTPLPSPTGRAGSGSAQSPAFPDADALCEMLTPRLSAAIARIARQRRYTP